MRVLGLDLESTGLDTTNDRITELGWVLWDVEQKQPLKVGTHFFYDASYDAKFTPETCELMKRLCGITPELLREFGKSPLDLLTPFAELPTLFGASYLVAHNGENFDKPFLLQELTRYAVPSNEFRALPWIDTKTDLPFVAEPESRRLRHLALDQGFINPFEHRAVFDVLTMLKVMSAFDIKDILTYQAIPFITIRAMVSYDDRQLAKDRRFSWEKLGEKTYPKCWVKRIKANKLDEEKKACGFELVTID